MDIEADIVPTTVSVKDYSFIGDIKWVRFYFYEIYYHWLKYYKVVPLSVPHDVADANEAEPAFTVDTCQRALIHVSGIATNCQKDQGSFDIDLEHYASALKDTKHAKAFAPLTCVIPDSPRYKNGKPVPYNRRYVSICGFLTDVTFKASSDVIIDRFEITVDDIAFMGQLSQGNNSIHANTLDGE